MHKTAIKAVFFDVDGTLISYDTHTAPQSTLDALAALRAKGIKVILASGRPIYLMDAVKGVFDFDALATMNGQVCYAQGEIVRSQPFAKEDIAALVSLAQAEDFPCLVLGRERRYINRVDERVRSHSALVGEAIPDTGDISRALEEDIYQFVIYTSEENEARLARAQAGVEYIRAAPMCLDAIPANGGKPEGMRALMAHFGIRREETMAFGDGLNDVTMLAFAGIGVAMGNAEQAARDAADYVTGTVEEGGIAQALRHYEVIA